MAREYVRSNPLRRTEEAAGGVLASGVSTDVEAGGYISQNAERKF